MKRFTRFVLLWPVLASTCLADANPGNLEASPFFATATLQSSPPRPDSLLISVANSEVITADSNRLVPRRVVTTFPVPLDKVQAFRSDGRKVDLSVLKTMLAKERVVVVSADAELPADRYRRLLSEDSLILAIGLPFLPRAKQTAQIQSSSSDSPSVRQLELQLQNVERLNRRGFLTDSALARARAELEAARRREK